MIGAFDERSLKFLQAFHSAPNMRLTAPEVSAAAKAAGYTPRGVNGYYTGNGCLRSEGEYRVLTEGGAKWFEEISPKYLDVLEV